MQKQNGGGTGTGGVPVPELLLEGGGPVTINNGGTASVQFTLTTVRITTAVSLSVSGLPSGVTAALTPASIAHPTASQTVTLKLTAAASAPAAKTTIHVKATSGTHVSSAPVVLTVNSPFSFVPGAPVLQIGTSGESTASSNTPVKLAAFGRVTQPLNLEIAKGVTGTISLAVTTALPAGVTAQFNPASVAAGPVQGGTTAVNLLLIAGANIAVTTVSVAVVASVGGADRSKFTFPLSTVAPFVSNVSPASGSVPMFERPGTTVTISGGGFGPGTMVAFGVDSPVAPSSLALDGTSLTVTVPPTAASGPIQVTSPAGVITGPSFAVDNYRNTRGLSWQNSTSFQTMVGGSYSFADATALFGPGQTIKNVGGGSFLGVPIPVVNLLGPFVNAFLGAVDALLDSNGQCFGMAQTSLQFITGHLNAAAFPQQPGGAEPGGPSGPDVWTLNGPPMGSGTDVSPALASLIHQQHMAQFSQEMINQWVSFHASVTNAAGLRNYLLQAFNAGGANGVGALVALNPSLGDGHVVVANDVIDLGGGNFNINVYNPNIQFTVGEDSNAGSHSTQLAASVINVMSNGNWVLPHSDLIFGGHTPNWTGNIFNITVIPWNTVPLMPTFPMAEVVAAGLSAGALVGILMAFVLGDAEVTQIGDTQGRKLLVNGQENTDPATRLASVRPMPALGGLGRKSVPAFVGKRQDALTHSITGKAGGVYTMTSLAHGVVATLPGVPTSSGATDTVSIGQGNVNFTGSENKPVAMTLVGKGHASNLPRTATLKTSASAGAAVNFSFDPVAETFDYGHEGAPANYSLELSSFLADGRATKFTGPAVPVDKGDKITVKPDWNQLSQGGGTVSVRSAAGGVAARPLKP